MQGSCPAFRPRVAADSEAEIHFPLKPGAGDTSSRVQLEGRAAGSVRRAAPGRTQALDTLHPCQARSVNLKLDSVKAESDRAQPGTRNTVMGLVTILTPYGQEPFDFPNLRQIIQNVKLRVK